jgi:hypothetical protein
VLNPEVIVNNINMQQASVDANRFARPFLSEEGSETYQ